MKILTHGFLLMSGLSLFLSKGPLETSARLLSVDSFWLQLGVIAAAYIVTLALSGPIVRFFILFPSPPDKRAEVQKNQQLTQRGRFNAGTIIGKCENILALTLILAGETGAFPLSLRPSLSYGLKRFDETLNTIWAEHS